jgi:hypothetical protein
MPLGERRTIARKAYTKFFLAPYAAYAEIGASAIMDIAGDLPRRTT